MSIVPKQPGGFPNRGDDQYARVAGKYVHEKSGSYYLELGPSGNYVLFEESQVIGTYEIHGAEITLFVARRPTSKAKIEDGWIVDEQGDRWVRTTAPPVSAPPVSAPPVTATPAEKQAEPVLRTEITQALPTAEAVLELEPEALGGYLLESLATGKPQDLQRDSFMSRMRGHYKQDAVDGAFLEAWAWLVREGFLIATRDETYLISRRGKKLQGRQDLETYRRSNILPKESLHPVIADRVWPNFVRGEYETAVFQAFKEVEAAVRTASGYPAADIGTDLMTKAFDVNSGPLTDRALPEAERQAVLALFAGAAGVFKNPATLRHASLTDAKEAAEMIGLASLLMKTVDSRRESAKRH